MLPALGYFSQDFQNPRNIISTQYNALLPAGHQPPLLRKDMETEYCEVCLCHSQLDFCQKPNNLNVNLSMWHGSLSTGSGRGERRKLQLRCKCDRHWLPAIQLYSVIALQGNLRFVTRFYLSVNHWSWAVV